MKTHNLILGRVRQGLGGTLTLPQFDVMAQLARAPEGLTFSELSRRLLVSAGNLTVIVSRLETGGLVLREVVERDRRSFLLTLTAAGRRRMATLAPRHRRDLEKIFSPVPASTQDALRTLLARAAGQLERNNGIVASKPGRRPGGR